MSSKGMPSGKLSAVLGGHIQWDNFEKCQSFRTGVWSDMSRLSKRANKVMLKARRESLLEHWDEMRLFVEKFTEFERSVNEAGQFGLANTDTVKRLYKQYRDDALTFRDKFSMDVIGDQVATTVSIPENMLGCYGNITEDWKREMKTSDVSDTSADIQYQEWGDILDALENEVWPSILGPQDKKTKSNRLLFSDFIASFNAKANDDEKRRFKELKVASKFKDLIVAAEAALNHVQDNSTFAAQDANLDRVQGLLWHFRGVAANEMVKILKRLELAMSKPVGSKGLGEFLGTLNEPRLNEAFERCGELSKDGATPHKYQSPYLMTTKRLINCLSCVCAVPNNFAILQGANTSAERKGRIAALYAVDRATSDRAVERGSLALAHLELRGVIDPSMYAGRQTGQISKVSFVSTDRVDIVLPSAMKRTMQSVSNFSDTTSSRLARDFVYNEWMPSRASNVFAQLKLNE